jgi:hypothetical protein
MKLFQSVFVCLLFICASNVQAQDQDKTGKRIVGIMPTFDTSGDSYGQQFAQNLTAMVYDRLAGAPFEIVLLNPGGLYSPLIPESMVEYTQSAGVDSVVVMTLLPTDKPQKGDYILHVEAKLLDAHDAKELAAAGTYSAKVSHNDALLDAAKEWKPAVRKTAAGESGARNGGLDSFTTVGAGASCQGGQIECAEGWRVHDQRPCEIYGEEGILEGVRHHCERRQ